MATDSISGTEQSEIPYPLTEAERKVLMLYIEHYYYYPCFGSNHTAGDKVHCISTDFPYRLMVKHLCTTGIMKQSELTKIVRKFVADKIMFTISSVKAKISDNAKITLIDHTVQKLFPHIFPAFEYATHTTNWSR